MSRYVYSVYPGMTQKEMILQWNIHRSRVVITPEDHISSLLFISFLFYIVLIFVVCDKKKKSTFLCQALMSLIIHLEYSW